MNLNFWAEKERFLRILKRKLYLDDLNFRAKNYVWHTVDTNFGQKFNFQNIKKIVNLNFWAEKQRFLRIFESKIYLDNLNFRAKNRGFFFVDNWQFLTCKFKFRNQYLTFFFQFLTGKFKFTILFISLKIEFLDTECQLIVFP